MSDIIKKLKLNDLNSCAKILKESYSEPSYNENFLNNNAYNYLKNKLNYCINHSFVIKENKNIIGFILINISYWTDGKQAIIEEIVIDKNKQRQKYGKKLIEYTIDYLKTTNVKSIILWTRKDTSAYNFHLKNKFIENKNIITMSRNL